MDDGGQQAFVAHHDGRAATCLHAIVLLKPCADIACLDVFCRCRYKTDVLGLTEIVEDVRAFYVEFVGKILEVTTDILACFGGSVIVVEIPIETGFTLLLKHRKETLLYCLQKIETHEKIGVIREVFCVVCRRVFIYAQVFHYLTVEHTLVGQALCS